VTPTGWLARDGLRLAIHDAGGPGAPVLFQHGLCGDAAQTAEAFPPLARHRRVTLECRGHGASDPDGPYRLATFAADLEALAAGLRPVAVGGISMGAAISLRLAIRRPDLAPALVLVRPAWTTEAAPPNLRPNAEVGALLATHDPAEARARFAAGATARALAAAAPDNLASLLGFFDRHPVEVTARLLSDIAADGPGITRADLAALRIPTLICATDEDAIHPVPLARELAAAIPGARLVLLPPKGRDKAAHLAALHAAIAAFLEDL
jgi:pimeloyl-ACP methyl ester carboxylesterase